MSTRRRVAIISVVAVGVLLVGIIIIGTGSSSPGAGPLGCPTCGGIGIGARVKTGKPLDYNYLRLTNSGPHPAVIDQVSLIDERGHLRILEVKAFAMFQARVAPVDWETYPPPVYYFTNGHQHTVRSLHLWNLVGVPLPHTGRLYNNGTGDNRHRYQVVIELVAPRPGRYSFRGIRLDYHVGSTHYVATYPFGFGVCASASPQTAPICQPPPLLGP